MRIKTLRFRNINSLTGEHRINFTDQRFLKEGIFLITGPTGSGKTTILDAICLALFGRTPRLKSPSQMENGLMNRLSGDCMAEVVFAGDDGREYSVKWEQNRAYKKHDGKLQAPWREFRALDPLPGEEAGTVTGIKEVQEAVHTAAGMEYDQFTRSMMLAQGAFSRFLDSDRKDRAKILENVTGTQVYSEISKAVHRICAEKKAEADQAARSYEQCEVLTDEDLKALEEQFAGFDAKERAQDERITSLKDEVSLLERKESAGKSAEQCREESDRLLQEAKRFEAEQAPVLSLGENAAKLLGDHRHLESSRKALKDVGEELGRLQKQAESLEKDAELAKAAVEDAASKRAVAEEGLERLREILKEVRVLDAKLEAGQSELSKAKEEERKAGGELKKAESFVASTRAKIDVESKALETLQKEKEELLLFEPLVASLAGFKVRLEGLSSKKQELEVQTKLAAGAAKDLEKAKKAVDKKDAQTKDLAAALDKAQTSCEENSRELADLLGEMSVDSCKDEIRQLDEIAALADRVVEVRNALEKSAEALVFKSQEAQETAQAGRSLESDVAAAVAALAEATERAEAQEQKVQRLALMAGFEEHRRGLKPGEPCPCCGATVHPYAEELPEFEEKKERKELKALKKASKDADTRKGKLESELAENRIELKYIEEKIAELAQTKADLEKQEESAAGQLLERLGKVRVLVPLFESCSALEEAKSASLSIAPLLEDIPSLVGGRQGELRSLVKSAEELEASGKKRLAEREKAAKAHAKALDDLAPLREAKAAKQAEAEQKGKSKDSLEVEVASMRESLARDLASFGVKPADLADSLAVLGALSESKGRWESALRKETEAKATVDSLRHSCELGGEKLKGLEAARDAALAKRQSHESELAPVLERRRSVFGDKNADEQEALAVKGVEACRENEKTARLASEKAGESLTSLKANRAAVEAQEQKAKRSLEDEEAEFLSKAQELGFASESAFCMARMPEKEIEALKARQKELSDERIKAEAQLKAKEEELLELEAQIGRLGAPSASAEESRQRLAEAEAESKRLHTEKGKCKEKLDNDAIYREKKDGRRKTKELCEAQHRKWQRLDAYIGSHDGKKFQEIAQNLTMSRLIQYANRELSRFTKRYVLKPNEKSPLLFDVVDLDMGSTRRGTDNLSGGESFLVSFSLALALSEFSRGRAQVETMFLDEGFGTLDAKTLDVALNAISGLRAGMDGRLVGIISHIDALKERIDTKITLEKRPDGTSYIL